MSIKKRIKDILGISALLDKKRYDSIVDYRALPIEKRVELMLDCYEQNFGYRMDMNHPTTYTEKIQWYKAFYTGDGHLDRIVDKYLFKQYIKEKLGDGYTIPLYGVYSSIKELEKGWKDLPQEFCMKSTVQSGGKWIEFIHDKSLVDFKSRKQEWAKWFNPKLTLINGLTQAYRNCTPRIIVEQYLENVSNQLFDYKFFCFDGKPYCVYVAQDHFGANGSHISFYDLSWNKLNVQYGEHIIGDMAKPIHLDQMIDVATKLSAGIPFVRVDFFETADKLYVSELTLYPGGGYTKYNPDSFNAEMGELFTLPIE